MPDNGFRTGAVLDIVGSFLQATNVDKRTTTKTNRVSGTYLCKEGWLVHLSFFGKYHVLPTQSTHVVP